jgi:hypothetical protein
MLLARDIFVQFIYSIGYRESRDKRMETREGEQQKLELYNAVWFKYKKLLSSCFFSRDTKPSGRENTAMEIFNDWLNSAELDFTMAQNCIRNCVIALPIKF